MTRRSRQRLLLPKRHQRNNHLLISGVPAVLNPTDALPISDDSVTLNASSNENVGTSFGLIATQLQGDDDGPVSSSITPGGATATTSPAPSPTTQKTSHAPTDIIQTQPPTPASAVPQSNPIPLPIIRPTIPPERQHDDSNHRIPPNKQQPLPQHPHSHCASIFAIRCEAKTHPVAAIAAVLLVCLVVFCFFRRRRADELNGGGANRGHYRRVASRFTADAFDDGLDDEDDWDGGFGDDDGDDGDEGAEAYANGSVKHVVVELSKLDRGHLSLEEVNG